MLKQRVMTACLLIPLTLVILFFASPLVFALLSTLVFLGAAFEWSNLMGLQRLSARLLYLFLTILVLMGGLFLSPLVICAGAFIWWLVALLLVMRYPNGGEWWGSGVTIRGFIGFIVLIPCWLMLNDIFNQSDGAWKLLFLFVLIWGADSAAYFAGKKWGRHKMAPAVSPGKTWEGLAGCLFAALLVVVITLVFCQTPLSIWPWAILLSLVTVLFSVVGDLFESMLKRNVHIKDSGGILPGHGGLLDRIDSLTAAVPVFVLGGLLLGMYL